MHIVTCSNCLDSKRIVALRTGVSEKKIFLGKFSHKFSCKLSILLVQNISVLDKLVSCVRVDYENKKQMLLHVIQFFKEFNSIPYICTGGIVHRDKRYALRSAEVLKFMYQSIPAVYIPHRPTPLEFFETSPKAQPLGQIKETSFSRDSSYHTNYLTTFYYRKAFQGHILVALASNNIITFY